VCASIGKCRLRSHNDDDAAIRLRTLYSYGGERRNLRPGIMENGEEHFGMLLIIIIKGFFMPHQHIIIIMTMWFKGNGIVHWRIKKWACTKEKTTGFGCTRDAHIKRQCG